MLFCFLLETGAAVDWAFTCTFRSSILFAAMDTTSNALSRIIHLLAQHPEVQEKARREVIEAHAAAGGDLNYDQLHALPYLDAVCRETLRL